MTATVPVAAGEPAEIRTFTIVKVILELNNFWGVKDFCPTFMTNVEVEVKFNDWKRASSADLKGWLRFRGPNAWWEMYDSEGRQESEWVPCYLMMEPRDYRGGESGSINKDDSTWRFMAPWHGCALIQDQPQMNQPRAEMWLHFVSDTPAPS